MKKDLTCIFLTVNLVPWRKFHHKIMLEAIGDYPLITISREPMDLPGLQMRQTEEQSHDNLFRQLLRGAKTAETDYVAMIEDDCLYHKDHLVFRPPLNAFGYNWNMWRLFTWGEPTFHFKRRYCQGASILPRLYLIEALEERFTKWEKIPHYLNGEVGYPIVEKNLGVTVRNSVVFYSKTPIVQIHHDYGTPGIGKPPSMLKPGDTTDLQARKRRKRMGLIRAYEVPFWGESKELVRHFVSYER